MMANLPLLQMMVPLPMQIQMKQQVPEMNSVAEADNAVKIILACFIHHSVKQPILPNELYQEWPVNAVITTAIWKLVNTLS
jgi:hypothetical protein